MACHMNFQIGISCDVVQFLPPRPPLRPFIWKSEPRLWCLLDVSLNIDLLEKHFGHTKCVIDHFVKLLLEFYKLSILLLHQMKTIKSIPWIELRIFNSLFDSGGRNKIDEETLTTFRNLLFTQSSTVFSTAEGGIKTILIVFEILMRKLWQLLETSYYTQIYRNWSQNDILYKIEIKNIVR